MTYVYCIIVALTIYIGYAVFLLKVKEEQRLSQVAINGLIGDITTLLEENLSLKKDVIQCMQEENALAELIGTIFQKNNSCTI